MPMSKSGTAIRRRTLLKAGLAIGVLQVASPFVLRTRAADVVKIGLDDPLTGPLAGNGKNELIGCQLAVDEINAKGGILGREVELIVEDSTSSDAGTAVLKARK
jgi:branched-chain amino acid transport system substrate-binding protein